MAHPEITINPDTERFVGETLRRLSLTLPYSPEHLGLNFSGAAEAVVINALVKHGDHYLVMQRSPANDSHVGMWNNIAGYMQGKGVDSDIIATITQELDSEGGIDIEDADSVQVGNVLAVNRPNQLLHVVPAIVQFVVRPEVTLNDENIAFEWMLREDFLALPRVPVVDRVFDEMVGPAE